MKPCFTVSGDSLRKGISVQSFKNATGDGYLPWHFCVGEEGRGRRCVRVPVPNEFPITNVREDCRGRIGDVVEGNVPYFLVLLQDMAGYRGSAEYENLPAEQIIASGVQAQGDAGRMGGAATHLVKLHPGQTLRVYRSGRLYGAPAVIEIRAEATGVHVVDVDAEEASVGASARF